MSVGGEMVLVIVPALNEAATVGGVVRALRAEGRWDVLVIDDGSVDGTADAAAVAGAMIAVHPENIGVGAAIGTGFRMAAERGYRAVVQVDADGQHDVESISDILAPVLADEADLVIGSRFAKGYELSRPRAVAMRLLSAVVSRRIGQRIGDTTSGFRAFGSAAIERFAVEYPSEYLSDTVEALLLAHASGLRIMERPVTMHQRAGGKASTGPMRSGYHLVRVLLIVLFRPDRAGPRSSRS
ncbi:MAG: glycosyltransferase family 2 protein [Acidimicrobiia bacterium]